MTQPKRPLSAYMLWMKDNRAAIVKKVDTTNVATVAKEAGSQWRKLSAKDKAKYDKQAVQAKKDFEKVKEEFVAAGGVMLTKSTSRKKASKDPNRPKRPANAYMLWMKDNRPKIVATLPKADQKSVAASAKAAGEQWKSVSAKEKA